MKKISNLKRQIRRDKEKDELKREEALVHVDYSQSYNSTQQMKFRVHILIRKTSVYLLPVNITVKPKRAI